jgi:acyl-homoserine-lactone acylase
MKQIIFFSIFLIAGCSKPKTVFNENVQIARDQWGVPHIHGKTDVDVVYGLAWAQCEDDFITLQEQLLAAKGMLGEVKGKDGLIIDFAIKFMQLREEVDNRYEAEIKGKHKELLRSFVAGINTFAALHPEEVLLKDAFPMTDKDLLVAYLLGIVDISGAGKDLRKIMGGSIHNDIPKGSNAIAISGNRTDSGRTFLAVNSHQPLEGWYSWYEVHLSSDEGLNVLGGTFPGGIMVFHGVNENLGWAHTVNHADFSDVYKLRMHEDKDHFYYFDGELLELEERKYWSWMKLRGRLKVPIRRTIYYSVYGPTFKTDNGFFAWRFVASRGLRASEQWFAMDKAKNFEEFRNALDMQAIPSTNIVYADREDNIFYISNAKIPKRATGYNWQKVLPGDTSSTLWAEDYYPLDSIPQVLNPTAGFVFNTNNSPYNATHPDEDPIESRLNKVMGFQVDSLSNNRSSRFLELISQYDTFTYEDLKKIKYDRSYPKQFVTPQITNLELLFNLDSELYPDIAAEILQLHNWDRNTNVENRDAALFFLTYTALSDALVAENRFIRGGSITEKDAVEAIGNAKAIMIEKYTTTSVPLGEIQRHIRGEVSLPLAGGPDVLAAIYWQEQKEGIYKGVAGESYILMAQFSKDGVKIETVNAYGSSAEPNSPHYNDQMEMFVNQQLKPMSLDIAKAFAEADTIYSPLKILE